MSTWTKFAVPLALVGVLFLCDASDAFAQSSRASNPAAPSDGDGTDASDDASTGSDAGSTDNGSDVEAPFQSKNNNSMGQEPSDDGSSSLRRSNVIEIDPRVVKGQGARAGAVYLFKRTPRKLPELVSLRTTYRDRIIAPVIDPNAQRLPSKASPSESLQVEARETPTKAPGAEEEIDAQLRANELRRRRRHRPRRRRSRSKNTSAPRKGQ